MLIQYVPGINHISVQVNQTMNQQLDSEPVNKRLRMGGQQVIRKKVKADPAIPHH